MREGVRNAVAIIVYCTMFVNMRCRVYSLYIRLHVAFHDAQRLQRSPQATRKAKFVHDPTRKLAQNSCQRLSSHRSIARAKPHTPSVRTVEDLL